MEKENARIDVADVLRGLSVLGITLLHSIEHYNFYSFPSEQLFTWLPFTDSVIWNSLFFTFSNKAYAIFALLFGFSFFIQDDNQRRRGNDFRLRFLWRLLLLFFIGQINAMFFTGEILVMYSLIGIILVLTCRLSTKTVFFIAAIFMLQPAEWIKVIYASLHPEFIPGENLSSFYFAEAFKVQTSGTFFETIKMNLYEGQLSSLTWAWENGRIFQTASLFMLGMLAGRDRLFIYSDSTMRLWLKTLAFALICFFPLKGLQSMLPEYISNKAVVEPLGRILGSLANFSFMLLLVVGVLVAFYHTSLKKFFMKLTPYGKMSLTNYIGQSVIGSMFFYNWGFGMYKHMGITFSVLFGVVLVLAQWAFCSWWMNRHNHGPLEGLWKKLTWINK